MKRIKWLKYALLCLYSAWMLYLLFFMRMDTPQADFHIQWVPFRTLSEQIRELFTRKPITPSIIQLGGNTLLFIPFGLLWPWCIPTLRKMRNMAITSLVMECAIEAIQGISRLGMCDIDDIILNLLGIAIGFGLFHSIKNKMQHKGDTSCSL